MSPQRGKFPDRSPFRAWRFHISDNEVHTETVVGFGEKENSLSKDLTNDGASLGDI